jgi:hypothetical protein
MITGCSLCGSSLTPVLDETGFWQVWLNYNQNLLGKLVIVLKRHEEQVAKLSAAEWPSSRLRCDAPPSSYAARSRPIGRRCIWMLSWRLLDA